VSIAIAIAGAAGRMGQALVASVAQDARFRLVGATERAGSPAIGADMAGARVTEDVSAATANADVWIDFTTPDATSAALTQCQAPAAIIGTTGFSAAQEGAIADAAKRLAIVKSGNFSLGVNLLAALVEQAAARLGDGWDIEIAEAHHRRKADAPSGTALMLGEAAARGRGKALGDVRLPESRVGARIPGGIGFSVTRAGGIIGQHDVHIASDREVLTLSHSALDRSLFADGALAAALWTKDKPPGLYSLRDVLGL
jgi:4-hydroxy-tetrahydrodipicolinate reductase